MPLFCFLFVNPKLLHRAMRSVSSSGNCRLDSIDRGPFQWYNAANFAAVKLLILFTCWLMRSSPPLGTSLRSLRELRLANHARLKGEACPAKPLGEDGLAQQRTERRTSPDSQLSNSHSASSPDLIERSSIPEAAAFRRDASGILAAPPSRGMTAEEM